MTTDWRLASDWVIGCLPVDYEEIYAAIKLCIKNREEATEKTEKILSSKNPYSLKKNVLAITTLSSYMYTHMNTRTYTHSDGITTARQRAVSTELCGQSKSYRMLHIILTIELCMSAASLPTNNNNNKKCAPSTRHACLQSSQCEEIARECNKKSCWPFTFFFFFWEDIKEKIVFENYIPLTHADSFFA